MGQINLSLTPKEKDLGDNFVVRRSLPDARKRMVGPYIFWDHMGPVTLQGEKELKVRAHPHIGLATITYLFSGEIMHRDSLNNEQAIRPGEVNWMTAGKGIVHSERSRSDEPLLLEGIQLWLALPKEHEDVDPSFYHSKESELPQFTISNIWMRLIAGEFNGEKSPVPVYSDLFYLNAKADKAASFKHQLKDNQEAAIYVVNGEITVDEKVHNRFDMVIFNQGAEINISTSDDCEFMLFGGEVFPEKRHIFWNFVSSSPDKIEQAKQDWREGKFPSVINEDELIPLPEG